jgi:hypothetical protein
MFRDSWLHQVNVRTSDGASRTLFRTSKKGDALLFHAATQKALELREPGNGALSNPQDSQKSSQEESNT